MINITGSFHAAQRTWDKIRHKMKLSADAKPFRRSKGSIDFEKRKAMKKIMEALERGNLVELLTRIEQPHPYLIKTNPAE